MAESYDWGTKAFDAKPLTKKQERAKRAAECTCDWMHNDLDADEHFLTCPCIIPYSELLNQLGLLGEESKQDFDGDYEVCYAHFSELPCAICALEDS